MNPVHERTAEPRPLLHEVVDGGLHEVGGLPACAAQSLEPAGHVIAQFDFPIHDRTITMLL